MYLYVQMSQTAGTGTDPFLQTRTATNSTESSQELQEFLHLHMSSLLPKRRERAPWLHQVVGSDYRKG